VPHPGVSTTWGAIDFSPTILEHLNVEAAILASGARNIPVAGREARVPRLLDDGDAEWTAEGAEIGTHAPDADEIALVPKGLKNVVSLSNESIDSAEVAVLDGVGQAMARAAARALDRKLFSADAETATAPPGIRTMTLPGAAGDPGTIDGLLTAAAAIRTAGGTPNAAYLAGADIGKLALLKVATDSNEPLLTPDQNGRYNVGGMTIWQAAGMPAGTALCAQADQIVVGVAKQFETAFSEHAKFTADSVVARVVGRFDWDVNDADGLYVIS
jgi:HK97 family phage major capsid protein